MRPNSRSLALCSLVAFAMASAGCNGGESDAPGGPAAADGAPATIQRDAYGVPDVYADTVRGLFHGYGYAVAEDRLYQMEMARRAVLGTVAEVLGDAYVQSDGDTRAGFDPASVRSQLAALSREDADIFEGYAAGFNARIREVLARRDSLMPKQFIDNGFEPSQWTAYDVAMIWIGTMANRFSNGSSEVRNLQVLNALKTMHGDTKGQQIFDQIAWKEDLLAPTTVPRDGTIARLARPASLHARATVAKPELRGIDPQLSDLTSRQWRRFGGDTWPHDKPIASNLWIVGPTKTANGSTFLLNGPQFGWFNPAYVFGIGLHGAGYNVKGNTPFAHPTVLFGTNGAISWGATAGPLDVNDVYQEKLNPVNPKEYMFNGSYRPMTERVEEIKVKGKPAVSRSVLSTVHGFVTSVDAGNATAYTLKRSWSGYEVQSLLAWIKIMKAQSWPEFLEQASKVAITINWYYADKAGNIGYVSPGRLPNRPATQDVRLPAVGDGSMEWIGIRPFSDNPVAYNPPQGFIANWNNQSAPGTLTDFGNYSVVDRVTEITSRIQAKPRLTRQDVLDINKQISFSDTNARYLVPYLVEATKGMSTTDSAYLAAQALGQWNFESRDDNDDGFYDDATATIMRTWLPMLFERVLKDDLPASVFSAYAGSGYPADFMDASVRPAAGTKLIYNALLGPKAGVTQTVDFFNGEDKLTVLRQTFVQAIAALEQKYGTDRTKWKTPVTKHRFLARNFMGIPQAGADEEMQLSPYMNRGTENNLVEFSGGKASLCTAAPPGQSGFIDPKGVKSRHYDDQMALYKAFECKEEKLD